MIVSWPVSASFLPFLAVDKLNPNAIRLGAWPEHVYAGRLSTLGERLHFDSIPSVRV